MPKTMMTSKKYYLIAAFVLIVNLCVCALVFCDSITLKSGKIIEGKIVEENEEYIKIEYEGIVLTYWKADIEYVNVGNRKSNSVEIKLKSDSAMSAQDFLNRLDSLEKGIMSVVSSTNSQMMSVTEGKLQHRDILQKANTKVRDMVSEVEGLSAPDYSCRELQKIVARMGSSAAQQLRGGERNFATPEERQQYWQQSELKLNQKSEEYTEKREALLGRINSKNQ